MHFIITTAITYDGMTCSCSSKSSRRWHSLAIYSTADTDKTLFLFFYVRIMLVVQYLIREKIVAATIYVLGPSPSAVRIPVLMRRGSGSTHIHTSTVVAVVVDRR